MGKKWTLEALFKEALKYNSRGEFRQKSPSAYTVAHRDDVMEQICAHMQIPRKRKTNEEIQQDALKCKTRNEFNKNYHKSYAAAQRLGILDQICAHMPKWVDQSGENGPNFKHTDEQLIEIALQYKTKAEFRKANDGAYQTANNRSILDKVCSHMPKRVDQSGENGSNFKHTDDYIAKIASEYQTIQEFRKDHNILYNIATKRGILEQVCGHMKRTGSISVPEESLFDLIKEKYPKTQKLRDRKVKIVNKPLITGFDIDIYIPELRKGIEFDGTYWHSAEGLKRSRKDWPEEDLQNYHQIKDDYFLSKGIELFHVKEEDWNNNPEEVLYKVLEFLNKK